MRKFNEGCNVVKIYGYSIFESTWSNIDSVYFGNQHDEIMGLISVHHNASCWSGNFS